MKLFKLDGPNARVQEYLQLSHLSDDSLGMELLERLPGQRAANLHPLGHDRGRDQLVRRDLKMRL